MINKRERETGRNIGKERGERERAGAGRGDTRWRGEKRCQNFKKKIIKKMKGMMKLERRTGIDGQREIFERG